jgi:putative alpha-1,2-mannosidase
MSALSALLCILAYSSSARAQSSSSTINYAQYVNPLIGSEGPIPGQAFGGGDIFVGGALPFGVVKCGIDTYETNLSLATINGGYTPQGLVTGVSLMHESGTGGAPKYGIVVRDLTEVPIAGTDFAASNAINHHQLAGQHFGQYDVLAEAG